MSSEYLRKKMLKMGDLFFLKYADSKIKIKDYFKLIRGKTPPTKNPGYYENGTIKWINSGVLTNLCFLTAKTPTSKLITAKAVKDCGLTYAQPNSVLLANIAPSLEKVVWVSKNTANLTLGTDIWMFSENIDNFLGSEVNAATLFFALRQVDFSNYITGSIIKRIQGSSLLNMKINWVSDPPKQKIFLFLLNKASNLNNLWTKLISK